MAKRSKKRFVGEILGLAKKQTGKPEPDEDRLNRLPPEFHSLRSITWGDEFMKAFTRLCREYPSLISRDLVVVVCELAHRTREALIQAGKGGRQKSFARILPRLLDLKNSMPRKPNEVVGFVLRQLH